MEILIWGDKMKKQISISIFLAIFVIILTLLYIKLNNDQEPEQEREQNEQLVEKECSEQMFQNSVVLSQENISSPFYIKNEDGWLVVYQTKTQERYMDTGIETNNLPADLLEIAEVGIFFETEQELYDFLESYSS